VQRDGVVHTVAHERDVGAVQTLHAHDARLRLRSDAREDRGSLDRRSETFVGERVDLAASEYAEDVQGEVVSHLDRDLRAVAGDDLHDDPEPIKSSQRLGGVCLRSVDEHEEADQLEVLLVGVARRGQTRRLARSDGDHARARLE